MYNTQTQKIKYYIFSMLCLLLLFGSKTITAWAEETDTEAEAVASHIPNDPYNDALWAFENSGIYTHYYGSFPVTRYSTEGIDLNLWSAWEHYPLPKEETRTVIIAIIDTGVDYLHPDLKVQTKFRTTASMTTATDISMIFTVGIFTTTTQPSAITAKPLTVILQIRTTTTIMELTLPESLQQPPIMPLVFPVLHPT